MRLTDSESENDIHNIKFKFGFNIDSIFAAQQKLPLEFDANISSFKEVIEANPPCSFDDLVPFD